MTSSINTMFGTMYKFLSSDDVSKVFETCGLTYRRGVVALSLKDVAQCVFHFINFLKEKNSA